MDNHMELDNYSLLMDPISMVLLHTALFRGKADSFQALDRIMKAKYGTMLHKERECIVTMWKNIAMMESG